MHSSISAVVFLTILLVKRCPMESIILVSPKSNYTVQISASRSPQFSFEECTVHNSRFPLLRRALRQRPEPMILAVDDTIMTSVSAVCERIATKSLHTTDQNPFSDITFPGTKWCGMGNTAHGYEDLGEEKETDICCREHDHCPRYIAPGDINYGLVNTGSVTISHCDCDSKFRSCLQRATGVADVMGSMYFNVMKMKCFKKEHPIIRCLQTTGLVFDSCKEYELDRTKPKIYQLFDNPTY